MRRMQPLTNVPLQVGDVDLVRAAPCSISSGISGSVRVPWFESIAAQTRQTHTAPYRHHRAT